LIPNAAPPIPAAPAAYGQPAAYPGAQYGGYPQFAPRPPRTLALWTIVLTGAYTATAVLLALVSPLSVEAMRRQLENPGQVSTTFNPSDIVNLLAFPVVVGSYVVLALWWGKVRQVRAATGYQVGGIPAVEWWGWLVPLANAVLPFLGMRSLTKNLVSVGALLGWWLPYLAASVASAVAGFAVFGAIDWSTGQLTDTSALDAMIPAYWASAILMLISWAFLAYIVKSTTDRCAGVATN
jgi:hypothetical protein